MRSADRSGALGTLAREFETWPQRYGFSLAAVALATLLRYGLGAAIGVTTPFILFYPTIILIALETGFGPGLFATCLSAAVAKYFFVGPVSSFAVRDSRDMIALVLFVIMGVALSGLGDLFRRRAKRSREFEWAMDGLDEMIVVLDRDYGCVIANRAFLDFHGIKRKDVTGVSIAKMLNPGVFEGTENPR